MKMMGGLVGRLHPELKSVLKDLEARRSRSDIATRLRMTLGVTGFVEHL